LQICNGTFFNNKKTKKNFRVTLNEKFPVISQLLLENAVNALRWVPGTGTECYEKREYRYQDTRVPEPALLDGGTGTYLRVAVVGGESVLEGGVGGEPLTLANPMGQQGCGGRTYRTYRHEYES
jgi:hypothetical protein